jgi:hypothetical protein
MAGADGDSFSLVDQVNVGIAVASLTTTLLTAVFAIVISRAAHHYSKQLNSAHFFPEYSIPFQPYGCSLIFCIRNKGGTASRVRFAVLDADGKIMEAKSVEEYFWTWSDPAKLKHHFSTTVSIDSNDHEWPNGMHQNVIVCHIATSDINLIPRLSTEYQYLAEKISECSLRMEYNDSTGYYYWYSCEYVFFEKC